MRQFNYKGIIIDCFRCSYKIVGVSTPYVGVALVVKEQYGNHKHEVTYLFPYEKSIPNSAKEAYILWPTLPHIVGPRVSIDGFYVVTFREMEDCWQNGKQQEND